MLQMLVELERKSKVWPVLSQKNNSKTGFRRLISLSYFTYL